MADMVLAVRAGRLAATVAVLLWVSAWGASAVAQTQSVPPADDLLSAAAKALKLKTDVGPMPDFVEKSQPPAGSLHYMPIGGARAEPAGRQLTVDEIKAEEAELDMLGQRHNRIAGRKNDPATHVSVADGRKLPKAKPKKPKCILTCDIMATPKPGEE